MKTFKYLKATLSIAYKPTAADCLPLGEKFQIKSCKSKDKIF